VEIEIVGLDNPEGVVENSGLKIEYEL